MLYDRWRQIVREFRGEIALRDMAAGRQWTFEQLASEAEQGTLFKDSAVFVRGNSSDLILGVLRGWRFGKPVCPLEASQVAPVLPAIPEEYVHLKITSGSTGEAKLIAFRPEQLSADARNIVQTMGLRREWPNIGVISLAHSYGFSNLVLPLLLHGIPLVLAPAPLPEIVRKAIEGLDRVTLPAVPALWRIWHDADSISPKVRLAISAGAPLPLVLESAVFERFGLKIHNFYGSSECGGIAYDATEVPRSDGSLAGEPMTNVEVSVDASGCLEVRSDAVGETYLPIADESLGNSLFRTSDLAEVIDGRVFLRGRSGDQINVAGRKVSPETIERSLRKHPGICECLVFGIPNPDADRNDLIVGCVAGRDTLHSEELRQFLLQELPAWQIPREWWFVKSLETNQRGKLSRAEWRKRYLAARS